MPFFPRPAGLAVPGRKTRVLFFAASLAASTFLAVAATEGRVLAARSPQEAAELLAQANAGDAIELASGTYRDIRLLIEAKGGPDNPVVWRAAEPGAVRFTGRTAIVVRGRGLAIEGFVFDQAWPEEPVILLDGAERCAVRDCAFIECGDPKNTYRHIVSIVGGGHHELIRNFMRGSLSMGMGIKLRENQPVSVDNQIAWNFFQDIVRRSDNGQECVQIGQGVASYPAEPRTVVEYNLFDHASGDAEIISNKSAGNVYRFNTFVGCDAELTLRGSSRARVEGNYFMGNKGGVRVFGSDHVVENNYIRDSVVSGIILPTGGAGYVPARGCLVSRNTIVGARAAGLHVGSLNRHKSIKEHLYPGENTLVGNLVEGDAPVAAREDGPAPNHWRGNVVRSASGHAEGLPAQGVRVLPKDADIDAAAGCDPQVLGGGLGRPLAPADVGPRWMKGDPANVVRIEDVQPIPPHPAQVAAGAKETAPIR